MTYITPQPLKCTRCGYEADLSLHNPSSNIVFGSEIFCHKCISEFLRSNIGVMKCTIDFTGGGSEYEKAKNPVANQAVLVLILSSI